MRDPDTELLRRIKVDPDVLVGKPTIRGLRISVEQVLRVLSAGVPTEELLADYPELEENDIRAVLAYAAERIADEQVFPVSAMGNMSS